MNIQIKVTENYPVAYAIAPLMNIWEFYCTEVPDHIWTAEKVDRNMTNETRGNFFVAALMIPTVNYCLAAGIEVDPRILEWIKECRWRAECLVSMLESMKEQKLKEMDEALNEAQTFVMNRAWCQVSMDLHEAKQMVEAFTLDPEEYKGAEKVELPKEVA